MANAITDTAQLACNQGTMQSNLLVTSQDFITIENKPIATEQDVKANINIKPFGQCKLKPSSSGYLPCVTALQKWKKTAQKNTINDNALLTDESFCICLVGGKITVKDKGHSEEHFIDVEEEKAPEVKDNQRSPAQPYPLKKKFSFLAKNDESLIKRMFFTDSYGNEITENNFMPNSVIYLNISGENLAGKIGNLELSNAKVDFEYESVYLENDILKNYTFKNDNDRIKLKVINSKN